MRYTLKSTTVCWFLILILSSMCIAATDTLTLSLETPELRSNEPGTPPSRDRYPSSEPKRMEKQITVGKVGVVAVASAAIYKSKSVKSGIYSIVKKDTPLAIIKEEGQWYGVLMVNGATGWISKHLVRLTGYELVADRSSLGRGLFTSRGKEVSRTAALGESLVRTALGYSGVRYVFGGNDPETGMDCSAFVRMVFRQFGIELPRTAREQALVGETVPFDQLQPGDRLYFQCKNGYIDHCGIYAGGGYFVHCSASRGGVAVDSLTSDFYLRSLVTAKRP